MQFPNLTDIIQTHHLIKNKINHTPVLTSSYFNNLTQSQIYFKCENFQKVGAFKFRGATNSILRLKSQGFTGAVATHSSGNHAQALALAARENGLKAIIVMPENSPKVKVNAVLGYGAEVVFCESNIKARETTLNKILEERKAEFIHPYENPNVIMGQGTAAYELINEVSTKGIDLDIIMAPIGGGGLISGTAIVAKEISKKGKEIKVIGAEPQNANDAFISFTSKERVTQFIPNTICDGLRTTIGEINFQIMNTYLDEILLAEENEIIETMKLVWERMKIIIEPSCSVPLATIIKNQDKFAGKKIGIILSGGNVDLNNLPWQ